MSEHPKSLLVCGESGAGKSFSLIGLLETDQPGVLYFNCEGGKPIPFKNKFTRVTIDDPYEIFQYLQQLIDNPGPKFHTVVIDTASFMMERFEMVHVNNAANTMAAWGLYGSFFREMMYDYVAKCEQNVVILAHLDAVLDEASGRYKYTVPVKGALKKNGLEAYFTTVINCKKVPIKDLEKYDDGNDLLTISERDRMLGFKHVYQTLTTKQTVGDRIRSPYGLFTDAETFINNDVRLVIQRLADYYAED